MNMSFSGPVLFVVLFFASVLLFAKQVVANTDAESHEQVLKQFMPNACLFTGRFKQQKVNSQYTLETAGRLFYGCGYGLIWQSETPFLETTLYKHDKQFWLVFADGEKEALTSAAQKGLADFLLKLMAADSQYFLDAFDMQVMDGVVVLIPKSNMMRKVLASIEVSGHKADHAGVLTMTMVMASGEKNIVTIDQLKSLTPEDKGGQIAACLQVFNGDQENICKLLKRKKVNVYKH